MNYYTKNIKNVKGDTYSIGFITEDIDQALDTIYFTCRDKLSDDSNIIFQKSLGNGISLIEHTGNKYSYAIRVAPYDTEDVQAGVYYYDLEIGINDDIFTIMKGRFIIEQDVTINGEMPYDPELYIKTILDEINGEVIGTSVMDKSEYLIETKALIKDSLNNLGAELSGDDTFRSYVDIIDDLYDEFPKVTDEGTDITLSTHKGKMKIDLKGNTSQQTYTGRNITNFEYKTQNGSTFNGNDITVVNPTSASYISDNWNLRNDTSYSGKTYTVWTLANGTNSGNTTVSLNIGKTGNSYAFQMKFDGGTTKINEIRVGQITLGENEVFTNAYIYTSASVTANFTIKLMIVEGSYTAETIPPYEPYVGKIPAPNPNYPQDIHSVTGNNTIIITNNDNSESQTYSINLGSIELCKIASYQDYIYKENGNWYLHKEIGKAVLDGSEDFSTPNTISYSLQKSTYFSGIDTTTGINASILTSHFTKAGSSSSSVIGTFWVGTSFINFNYDNTDANVNTFKTWLYSNHVDIYYALATATNTQITNTDLIAQLEAILNATSYDPITNISSEYEENNAPFIINATALMKGGN